MEGITKEDLRLFKYQLLNDFRQLIDEKITSSQAVLPVEWIKAGKVRKFLDMSPGSLQNLRISGKIRFKKIQGAYYYNLKDLKNLFK